MDNEHSIENNITVRFDEDTSNPQTVNAEVCSQQSGEATTVIIALVVTMVLETVLFLFAMAACYLCCSNKGKRTNTGYLTLHSDSLSCTVLEFVYTYIGYILKGLFYTAKT